MVTSRLAPLATHRRRNSRFALTATCLLALMAAAPCPASPTLVATLTPQTSGPVNRFANHLDVDGDRVIVGAYEGAFIFHRPAIANAPWAQQQYLQAYGDTFGASRRLARRCRLVLR